MAKKAPPRMELTEGDIKSIGSLEDFKKSTVDVVQIAVYQDWNSQSFADPLREAVITEGWVWWDGTSRFDRSRPKIGIRCAFVYLSKHNIEKFFEMIHKFRSENPRMIPVEESEDAEMGVFVDIRNSAEHVFKRLG